MPDFKDLISLVRGQIPDKPLVAIWSIPPGTAGVVGGVPDLIRYYFDVDERLRIDMKLRQLLPEALILPGFWPSLGVVVEASAFGGQIVWSHKNAPHIIPPLRRIEEVDSLKPPTPGETGMTPLLLIQMEVIHRKLKDLGLDLEKWIKSMGPAETAGLLLGYETYFLSLYEDPGRLKSLMDMVTEFIIKWLRLQEAMIGEAEVLQLADHVPSQVRPEHLEEFILPYMRAVYSEFPKAIKIYHNEGFHSDQHIDMILHFGADIWHFGSDVHSLSDVYAKIGDVMVPFGGVNPHGAMRHGTPEEVAAETQEVLKVAKGRRVLLSTGTGTTPEATLENVRAMIETALS
jgi:uroporphyrinogen decarboxylase